MKRIVAFLIVLMVAFSVWGCSSAQDDSLKKGIASYSAEASSEASAGAGLEADSVSSTEASQSARSQSKPARNGYDEATNFSLEVAGLEFSVPACFEASSNSGNNGSKYYYAETGSATVMLMTQVVDLGDSTTTREEFEAAKDEFAKGLNESFASSEVLDSRDFELAALSARRVSLASQLEDVDFRMEYVFFFNQDNNEIGIVAFGQSDGSRYDYFADIDKLIASAKPAVDEKALAKDRAQKALASVKLTQKKDVLEYSKKEVDPLKFVECDNADVKVSTAGKIDLTKVGPQEVVYVLALDGERVEQSVTFNVRDTKAPKINFKNKSPEIEVGDSYDPEDNVTWVKDPVDGKLELVDEEPDIVGEEAGSEVVYEQGWYTVEGDVDSSTPGSYDITVTAADVDGNVATRTFAVTVKRPEVASANGATPAASNVHRYVLNTNTGKFHNPYCRDISRMKEFNKAEVEMTRDEVVAMGYSPCGHCRP